MELVYVIGSKDTGVPFKIGKSNKKSLKNRQDCLLDDYHFF